MHSTIAASRTRSIRATSTRNDVGTPAPAVPLFDLRLSDEDVAAVVEALRSGWLTMGPRTQAFEAAFAEHLGVRHAIALSSATAALHLAYIAAGVEPGDEVIVPAFTFVAAAAAARYCGAVPVFADIHGQHDLGLDPADVAERMTARTKAVCAVHYAGYRADVDELQELCVTRSVRLIEDAAHSPIIRPVGLAAVYSFFSNKVLSCGEGGLLATDDDGVATLTRRLRSHAMTSGTWDRHLGHATSYDVGDTGYNYRLDEPRAALLAARLLRLDDDVAQRRRLVRRYRENLLGVAGLTIPYDDAAVERSACYVMPLMVDDASLRDPLRQLLLERHGVQTSVLYPAIHEFAAYRDPAHVLPRSEHAARTQLTIPLYPHLTAADQDRVIDGLVDGLDRLRK